MDLPGIGRRILGLLAPKANEGEPESGNPDEISQWFAERHKHAVKRVNWILTVHAMYSDINSREILVRTTYGDFPQAIWAPLDLSVYPEILHKSEGTRLRVQGLVYQVKGEDIYLKDCMVEFLPEDENERAD